MIVTIDSLDDPRLSPYRDLTAGRQRADQERDGGYFIAESPKVIRIALEEGLQPLSLLCEERHIAGDAADIVARCGRIPIYTGSRQALAALTGYPLTRGVLCALQRPKPIEAAALWAVSRRLVVIDGVADSANVGAIFRAAAALGRDGVLLTPSSCSPLLRRSVRVSMGAVLQLPWAWAENPSSTLHAAGFSLIALALSPHALPLDSPVLKALPKTALVLGTEGDGLSPSALRAADYVARIPMQRGIDSLNVASAAAVAFWELR